MQLAFVPRDASPIRRQYLALKHEHPGAILFFQLGDFYETFEDDARTVAEVCEVALTSREMGHGERVPMAGVPVHAAETYIARLVEHGYHVALCRQVENPAEAAIRGSAGLVRREVIRVITPGTLVDPGLLPVARANLLAAMAVDGQHTGIAYVDINSGELGCTEIGGPSQTEAARAELWRLEPAEILLEAATSVPLPTGCASTDDQSLFLDAETTLCSHFGVASLVALGLAERPFAARAAAAIIRYAARTNPQAGALLREVKVYDAAGHMILDPVTRDHLELTRGARGRKEGSLLHTLDRTLTPMGARLLNTWLASPLLQREQIQARLDAVETLVETDSLRSAIRERLSGLPDLERLTGRAVQRLLGPREALALARAIEGARAIADCLQVTGAAALAGCLERLDVSDDLAEQIRGTLVEDPPVNFGEGVIQAGRLAELDELSAQSSSGRQWLLDLERAERDRSGVRSLKIGYNRVFGYYLEVPTAALGQALDYYRQQETGAATVGALLEQLGYQRRQTTVNAERFVVPALRDYERQQARSTSRMADLEREVYEQLVAKIASQAQKLLRAASALAELDAFAGLASLSRDRHYVRPELTEEPIIEIRGGRHPVVESALGWSVYVASDLALGGAAAESESSIILLTGPNMAGKTTYGRMVLLICLMAQVGCFVPAARARLGLVDRLFLRSGASDDIAGGQSTFMVEMTEAAAILRSATPNSLAFFDEVGRGTSTYDGMAIARAIVEFLATSPSHGCRVIFSTHYHELAVLEAALPKVRNYRMEVVEAADQVVFTYRVVPGNADRSYGVHVARLAGLPPSVVARAEEVLAALEAEGARGAGQERQPRTPVGASTRSSLIEELAGLEVDILTPIEALNRLARLRAQARTELEAENGTQGTRDH
ncbi:MAG: DNA mismatch repair protein MutS [Chloroflexi bacterium]|nr:DNA mismatch repair protein MutS [Chloroflexota bacterium]